MTLRELLKAIQDACLNDGNLNKEVEVLGHTDYEVVKVKTEHPNTITIYIE